MKISTNSRYAVRFLIQLSLNKTQPKQSVASIAEIEGLSEKMLERIAAKLKKAGIVKSAKGVGGGYELNMPASDITISRVLELMETPYLPLHCVTSNEKCIHDWNDCKVFCLWEDIETSIKKVTDTYTIEKLAGNK